MNHAIKASYQLIKPSDYFLNGGQNTYDVGALPAVDENNRTRQVLHVNFRKFALCDVSSFLIIFHIKLHFRNFRF